MQFATVYLPALDIVLNRLPADTSTKLALSTRALDALAAFVAEVRARGYDVLLIGLPGDKQSGSGVLAWTFPAKPASADAYDVAPTLCDLLGFPATSEMPGRSIASAPELPRIATFGRRAVNDGKLASRLRNGGRITTETLDRIRGFMTSHEGKPALSRPFIIERNPTLRAPQPTAGPVAIASCPPNVTMSPLAWERPTAVASCTAMSNRRISS